MGKKRGTGSTSNDRKQDDPEPAQSNTSTELVLIITASGTEQFKQELIDALKVIDLKTVFAEHEENRISVEDIHGRNVLWPEYQILEKPSRKKAQRKRDKN
jgi:hypothetical protein